MGEIAKVKGTNIAKYNFDRKKDDNDLLNSEDSLKQVLPMIRLAQATSNATQEDKVKAGLYYDTKTEKSFKSITISVLKGWNEWVKYEDRKFVFRTLNKKSEQYRSLGDDAWRHRQVALLCYVKEIDDVRLVTFHGYSTPTGDDIMKAISKSGKVSPFLVFDLSARKQDFKKGPAFIAIINNTSDLTSGDLEVDKVMGYYEANKELDVSSMTTEVEAEQEVDIEEVDVPPL